MAEKIAIVLPCYNPEKDWQANVLANFHAVCARLPQYAFELVIVNDGSAKNMDATAFSNQRAITLIHSPINEGKGATLRKGMLACTADFYVYTDIDFPYTMDSLVSLITALVQRKGNIVAGVRNSDYYKNVPPFRQRLSVFLRFWVAKSFNLKIDDTQCGLKGFDAKGKAIFLQTKINRYLFDLEFIFLASKNDALQIVALPVQLKEGVIFSKINTKILLTESVNFLKIIFRC